MSLGEWDEDAGAGEAVEVSPEVENEVVTSIGSRLDELDVAGSAHALVNNVVASEVERTTRAAIKDVLNEVSAEVFTDDVLEEIRDQARQGVARALRGESIASEEDAAPALYYGSVDEFVREFVCPVYSRKVGEKAPYRWRARWWENTEAVVRLESLWRAWEHLRQDAATGMSVFLRDHMDHHMAVLLSPDGPFRDSDEKTRVEGEPLPYEAPPEGLFPDVRTEDHGA